jgi:hypothetical protein
LEDLAHPAARDEAEHGEAAGEDLTGLEAGSAVGDPVAQVGLCRKRCPAEGVQRF